MLRAIVLATLLVLASARAARCSERVELGELRNYATLHSVGIEWDLDGDDDHDAVCTVRYRVAGANAWRPAYPLLRIDYQWTFEGRQAGSKINRFAGSILFLEPGTRYEVHLDAHDPDGGVAEKTFTTSTRPVPTFTPEARERHVVPSTSAADTGGTGTMSDPFRGLDAAQKAAAPLDVFLLHAGSYGRFVVDRSGTSDGYIVWKSAGDGEAIFEQLLVSANHVWLEGLTLKKAAEATALKVARSPVDVVVARNRITGFHNSIVLNNQCRDWYIADNTIVGDNDPVLKHPAGQDGEGIELNDSGGHVVCHNDISRVADGVSYPGANVDIFGNDIHDVCDDALEPDHGEANVRIWGNRLTNYQYVGISFQPMRGGPWYIVRNQLIGRGEPFKFYGQDRFVAVNNTFVFWRGQSRMQSILKSVSRNNLYVALGGKSQVWDARPIPIGGGDTPNRFQPDWKCDVDYDGFAWDGSQPAFRWDDRTFADLPSFSEVVGIERHATRVPSKELFEKSSLPDTSAAVAPENLTLLPRSPAIDAGIALPNLSDRYTGRAPDLGAHESSTPPPTYGPRPLK